MLFIIGIFIFLMMLVVSDWHEDKSMNRSKFARSNPAVGTIGALIISAIAGSILAAGVSFLITLCNNTFEKDYSISIESLNSVVYIDGVYDVSYNTVINSEENKLLAESLEAKKVTFMESDENKIVVMKKKELQLDFLYSFGTNVFNFGKEPEVLIYLNEPIYDSVRTGGFLTLSK